MNALDVVHLEFSSASIPSSPHHFLESLSKPTAFFVRGQNHSAVRVVAGSIHGNEPSGLRAIHRYLCDVVAGTCKPATNVWLFVGGVEAAKAPPRGLRMLPGRRDLNRCFRAPFDGIDGAVGEDALRLFRAVPPEAVVDLHNNTGKNPAYTVTPELGPQHLWLGRLFATRFVLSQLKLGAFSEAFEDIAPSVTVECGIAGHPESDATAYAGLRRFMAAERVETAFVSAEPLQILTDSIRVTLASGLKLAFGDMACAEAHLTLEANLDRHNFAFLPAGTPLGWVHHGGSWPVVALDESDVDRAAELFVIEGDRLLVRRSFIPIMMTTDAVVAVADCLFYATTRRE